MATKKESPASGEPAEKGVVSQEARNSGRNSIALDPPPLESVRMAPVDDIAKSLTADMDADADVAEAYNDGRTLEEILEGYTTEEAQKKLDKYGYNEVLTTEEPEWKKILSR